MTTIGGSSQVVEPQVVNDVQTSVVVQPYQIPEGEFRAWAEETFGEMPFAESKLTNLAMGFFHKLGMGVPLPHAVSVENGKKVLLNPRVVQEWLERNEINVSEDHAKITQSLVDQYKAHQIFKKAFPQGERKVEYYDSVVDLSTDELNDLASGLSQGGKLAVTVDSKVLEKTNLTRRELIKGMSIPVVVEKEPKYLEDMRTVKAAELTAHKAGFLSDFLAGMRKSITGGPVVVEEQEEVKDTVQV